MLDGESKSEDREEGAEVPEGGGAADNELDEELGRPMIRARAFSYNSSRCSTVIAAVVCCSPFNEETLIVECEEGRGSHRGDPIKDGGLDFDSEQGSSFKTGSTA